MNSPAIRYDLVNSVINIIFVIFFFHALTEGWNFVFENLNIQNFWDSPTQILKYGVSNFNN